MRRSCDVLCVRRVRVIWRVIERTVRADVLQTSRCCLYSLTRWLLHVSCWPRLSHAYQPVDAISASGQRAQRHSPPEKTNRQPTSAFYLALRYTLTLLDPQSCHTCALPINTAAELIDTRLSRSTLTFARSWSEMLGPICLERCFHSRKPRGAFSDSPTCFRRARRSPT